MQPPTNLEIKMLTCIQINRGMLRAEDIPASGIYSNRSEMAVLPSWAALYLDYYNMDLSKEIRVAHFESDDAIRFVGSVREE
jgi:hypothetical protein